jgi:serine/threonine protein kinase/tetratricopeptide (TPR) repeat protein
MSSRRIEGMQCPKCESNNPNDSKFCKECGTQITVSKETPADTETLEAPKEELTTGSTFAGRYQIIEELGRGGMGRVYKATDTKIKEKVALKLIKPEIASDKKTLERFGNELRIARKLTHKNVGKMFDINEEEGTHYITMEFVSGQDLKGLIRQSGQLGIGTALSIAKQMCEGLAEAHKTGVIHRDLKPSNIMIDQEGNVRIMDFGIARSLKEKGITGAGVMIGTPEYMSPEQAEAKEVDQRSDIYSLGAIMYEMVTGSVPFEGDTVLSIAMKHKGEEPKDPREFNTQLSADVSRVILKCLEKDQNERYQSAGEVRSELEHIEKGIPTTERMIPERKPITSKEITVTLGLKKVFIPVVVVVALVLVAIIIWQLFPQKEAVLQPSGKPAVAVLPFVDLSPQKDQEHFCDGMTDEIIAKLSQIKELKVISRTSAMRYKNTDKDIKEIGQELDVSTILEGSVRKEKENIRVTAQLINVGDSFHLWSDIYDRKLESVFGIQSDIAERIADALQMKLSQEEKDQLDKKPTENMEAYNLYLQGRWFWNRRTSEGMRKAIEYYNHAIAEDPRYALAYSGIADSYTMLGVWSFLAPEEAHPKAKAAAMKAIELDDMLAEAHASLASVRASYSWDWPDAEKEFKRALELNPNYAMARLWYGALYLKPLGQFEKAMKEVKLALDLDPLSPIINYCVGDLLYTSRMYDQAIEAFQRVLALDPNFPPAYYRLTWTYIKKGMYDEAFKELEKTYRLWNYDEERVIKPVRNTYAKSGFRAAMEKAFDVITEESKTTYWSLVGSAKYCVFLARDDEALELLEKAYEQRESDLTNIKTDPIFDDLHSYPRFKALLEKMGLEK